MRRQLALLALAACSPANPKPNVEGPVATLAPPDASAPHLATPARWTLIPHYGWQPRASLAVGSETLQIGLGGERWLTRAGGEVQGAASLAPEELAAVARGSSSFRFIGASGALYEAPAPLAPLTRLGEGVKGVTAVAVGEQSAFVIDRAGELHRSPDGKTWSKVAVDAQGGTLVDVTMLGKNGLLLAAPQRIFSTQDDGATWKPLASPNAGLHGVKTEGNDLVLEGASDLRVFDPRSEVFAPRQRSARPSPARARRAHRSAMDGKLGVIVESDEDQHEHRVAVVDAGGAPLYRPVPELDGCFQVNPAIRARTVWLACDGVAAEDGSVAKVRGSLWSALKRPPMARDGGRATGMITKLFRSEDGGKSFEADATLEGGTAKNGETSFFVGEGGFVFLGARCEPTSSTCVPARARASAQAQFTDLSDDPDAPRFVAFATRGGQTWAVGATGRGTALYKWNGGAPELVRELAASTGSVSLDVDDAGAARVFLRSDRGRAWLVEGSRMTEIPLPERAQSAAFAGRLGLAIAGNEGFETLDGKTWNRVPVPLGVAVSECSEEGCVTTRGLRAGWEGAARAVASVKSEPRFAKGLRCRATGAWTSLGGGDLPTADNVDHAASRWLVPVRDLPGAVTLLTNAWSSNPLTTSKLAMTGPAPQPPTYGAQTTMRVQPRGVVVMRYSYLRQRGPGGAYNPVDMSAVWYRAQSGKIFRGAVSKLPPFRVTKDPQFEGTLPTPALAPIPEIVSLGPRGLAFHSPFYEEQDWFLHHLRDDGRVDKLKIAEPHGDEGAVVDAGGALTLVSSQEGQWYAQSTADQRESIYGIMAGLDNELAPVSIFDVGGKASFVATLRYWTPRAWVIPIAAKPDLGASSPFPTQLSIGDKACTDAAPAGVSRVVLPWVLGSRRAVTLEIDATKRVLASGRVAARVMSSGEGCATAIEATDDLTSGEGELYSALVFPGDLNASLVFRATHDAWPNPISVRPLSCAYAEGPLPEEIAEEPGFVPE